MTEGNNRRSAANRGETGLGMIQYFVVGGAGLAIAAIAVSEAQLPLPRISSEEFSQKFASHQDREPAILGRDYKPSGEAVARVHQSEIALTYQARPASGEIHAHGMTGPMPTIDGQADRETIAGLGGSEGSIQLAAVQEVLELTGEMQVASNLKTDFAGQFAAVHPAAVQNPEVPELLRTVPVPPSLADGTPAVDLGVMELTAEQEFDERLLAAIEPRDLDLALAQPQADAVQIPTAAAVADTPVLVLTEEDMLKSSPNQALAELLERATPSRVTLSPALSGFDLAKVDGTSNGNASALNQVIELQKPVQANGLALGNVDLRISGDSRIEVRLGSIVSLLKDQMEPALYNRLISADSAAAFVTFADLRAAGIRIHFDPVRDLLTLSTDAS